MIDNELQVRLLHAAKTQDQWKAVTSYPKKGEVCLEAINTSGATAFKIKIGDGTRPYCRNTGTTQDPVWDFTSDQVLPYFGSVIETSGSVGVVAISTYDTTKKKLSFYNLSLTATTSGGSTTLTPTIEATPYLEVIEGDGISFTTDETGTVKEFYINVSAVGGNKIDVTTNSGNIVITHEDIDTTATDVASTITTDDSSIVDEKELNIITGLKVDAQGHITHIDKDKSTNLVAADLKGSVSVTDNSAWIYRPTGGTISIGEDIAKIKGLEGQSCVWNQLVENGDFTSASTFRARICLLSLENNIVTLTKSIKANNFGQGLYPLYTVNTSHKYYASIEARLPLGTTETSAAFGFRADNGLSGGNTAFGSIDSQSDNFTRLCGVGSPKSDTDQITLYGATNSPIDSQIKGRNFYMIDLTLLGIDNLTTVAEVEAWLAQHVGTKPYYAYNAGELLSAKTLGFNTYSQNLLNHTTNKARLVTYTDTTNSNKYTIKNVPDNSTVTYTPDNTGTAVDITSLIENDTFDITSYGNGLIEFSSISDDTYVCIKWDGSKDDDVVPYEEHNYNFDVTKVYGRVSGAGEYVQCFQSGMRSVGNINDSLTASEAVVRIDSRAYQSGDESDSTVITDGTNTLYVLSSPITYTDLIYSENGGQTGTTLKKVLLTMNVSDFGAEEQVLPDYVDNNPVAVSANTIIEYKSNFKEAVLETIDKVNSYKNPVRSTNDTPQSTGKVAVYDSDSTVKSSTFEISNTVIDPEGASNENTVPTIDAIVDYIADVVDTEVTVQDITTTDDDVSGNGGIRITNTGTTYDVHHADITQAADVTHTITPEEGDNNEAVVKLVTGVITDDFGHVKGKEVISSDKLIAADIKAPITFTDKDTWLIRPTSGSHDVTSEDIAKVVGLEGQSCVWNQMISMPLSDASKTVNGVTITDNRDGSYTIITDATGATATVDLSIININDTNFIEGHKYYIAGGKQGSVTTASLRISGTQIAIVDSIIYNSLKNGTAPFIRVYNNAIITTPITLYPQVVDLTLLGIDNLTTVSQVEAWLAQHVGTKPYYDYNAGEILSAKTLGIKTYGQNLLNPTTKQAKLIPYTWEENSNVYTIKNVPSGATATFTPDNTGVAETVDISGGSLDITSYGSGILELSAATADTYVCMKWDGQKDDDVVPYEDHTYDFDVRKVYGKISGAGEYVQCFPNGMKSAGNIHDTLTASEAIEGTYIVDLSQRTSEIRFTGTVNKTISFTLPLFFPKGNVKILSSKYKYIGPVSGTPAVPDDNEVGLYTYNGGTGLSSGQCYAVLPINSSLSGVIVYDIYNKKTYTDLVYRDNGVDTPFGEVLLRMQVNNWSIEEQLITPYTDGNPTSTAATITIQYKSNFKDAIKDLIDKVNNQKNPVMGVSNTGQTVDKIAIYDSASTVHSSNYSPSNATIVEGATGNNIILPSVEALITYVNSKLSSALTYKGTIDEWSDLPTSGQSVGDMYIASAQFTEQGTIYNAGDFFIWNGTSWDIVSGTTSVVNGDVTLAMDGSEYTLGTIDGVDITVTTPNLDFSDPSANGNSLSYIDTISQTDGQISATKKTIPDASTSQKGVVELSSGIESATSGSTDVPTDYETLTNLNLRDVGVGTLTNSIGTLTKRMYDDDSTSQTYATWINQTFYPTTKLAAIDSFSTDFATEYPDLAAIEALGSSSPTSGFPKRASDGTWSLTEDTGKMKWLDEVTNTYTYSTASTNDEELGSYIHNYVGVTSVEKATITNDNNKYGFRIDVPILTSASATVGKVLKGLKDTGVTSLPTWGYLSIEELDELDNLSSTEGFLQRTYNSVTSTSSWSLGYPNIQNIGSTADNDAGTTGIGYLKRTVTTPQSGSTPAVYGWEFDPYGGSSRTSSYADGTEIPNTDLTVTTPNKAGLKEQTGASTYAYKRISFAAITNDTSTGDSAVTIILNGNFS